MPAVHYLEWLRARTIEESRRWRGDPDEVLGEVWIRLNDRELWAKAFDPEDENLRKALSREVRNCHRKSRRASLAFALTVEPASDSSADPAALAAGRESCEVIATALAGLNPRRREAVAATMGIDERRSVTEVARHWGTTPQNVRKQCRKGIDQLRGPLTRFDPRPSPETAR